MSHAQTTRPSALRRLRMHQQLNRVIQRRIQIELLAASISGHMLGAGIERAHRVEQDVRLALREIGVVFGADYCFLHLLSSDGKIIERGYEWRADGLEPIAVQFVGQPASVFPYMADDYRARAVHGAPDAVGIFIFPDIAPEPDEVRDLMRQNGVQAAAFIPLRIGINLIGYCGLRSRRIDPDWPADDLKQLKLMGEVIANALLTVRAEEGLAGERNLLQSLIDAVPHTLYAKDINGRVIASNRTAAAMDARTPQETIGRMDRDVFDADAAQQYRNDEQAVIETGIPLLKHEEIVVDNIGARRWFSSIKTPLRDETGAILGIAGLGRDITEEKKDQQALNENEARFRMLFEASTAGIAILRVVLLADGAIEDYEYVDVNRRYESIMQAQRDVMIGKRFTDVLGAASISYMKGLKAVADSGAPYHVELYSNSVQKHLYLSVCQMGPGYMAVIVIDITESKQAEAELRQAEAGYRNIFENATMGVFRSMPDGRYLFVNTALAHIYGYDTPQEMLDDIGNDILHRIYADPQQRAEFTRILNSAGVITNFEAQHRRKDGSVIWTRVHARTTWSAPNIPLYYDGFLEDITARKEAARIIQERERQFRFLAENMHDVIWTMDNERRYTYISPSIRLLRGLEPEQAMRQEFMEPFTPESRAIIRDAIARRAAAEAAGVMDSVFYLELRQYHVDGKLHWVELLMQALLDAQGRRTGLLGITRDITARKRAEESLQFASTHDALTGLYNRACFQDELNRLCNEGRFPFSIILADVDGLKRANDQLGHAAGDELLRRTARVLTAGCRSDALVARYGGDEFAVLLPETSTIAARAAVLLVQAELNAHNAHAGGAPLSIAIGVATTTRPMNPDEIMSIVDARMYDDKRAHSVRSLRG
jgi:diguanylate cyclase (GGDEF)-like protein/PAS domain S-box-containing protein